LTAVKTGKTIGKQHDQILEFWLFRPIDGHDIFAIVKELKRLQKKIKGPKFFACNNYKGRKAKTGRREIIKIPRTW
jgi:1-deoxy-D-xylulose-5-phosphate synthase